MKQINKTLYAKNKDDSIQEWKVSVEGDTIFVEYGKLGGKIQTKKTVCEPKNVGRSNETTAEEQALSEAQSKWEKQVRLGYRESVEQLENEVVFSPMLAHDAIKRSKSIIYPCYVQPKLDGLRCLVTFTKEGEPVFNSRGNKTYPIQGKIVEQIKELRKSSGVDMFDGELYIHGLPLQSITSLAKKWKDESEEGKNGGYNSNDLTFEIFDIPSDKVWDSNLQNLTWDYNFHPCRYADLMNVDYVISARNLDKLHVVHGSYMNNERQVKDSIGEFMSRGFEGSIIRNLKGTYEYGQRSVDLQKWKIFQTIEAKVLSVTLDKNGEGVLNCILQSGVQFSCKMKGTHEYRSYENMLTLVDKFITISFQAYTEDDVPQFPVGIGERDVNPVTWEVIE